MRSSLCSSRSFAAANEKLIFLIFTVKRIILQIIWLILVTLLTMVCIFLIHQIGACLTGFITIL
ncbi:hypothetical protein LINGRAHAP2_LOCUS25263 [Linum grandiflorum]